MMIFDPNWSPVDDPRPGPWEINKDTGERRQAGTDVWMNGMPWWQWNNQQKYGDRFGPSLIPGQPQPVEPSWPPPPFPGPGVGQPLLDPLPPPAPAPPTRLEEGASGKTVNEEISELFRSRGLILNKPSPPSGLPPGFGQPPPPTPQRQHYPGQAPPPTPARLPPGFGPSPPPTPQIAATPPGTYAPSAQPGGGPPPLGPEIPIDYDQPYANLSELGPSPPDTPRISGAMVQPEVTPLEDHLLPPILTDVTPSLPAAQAIPPQFSSAQMASSQMADASPAASTVAPPLARSVAGPSMTLVNSSTGDEQTIPLDGTPETSELLNSLMQQGYVNRTPPPAPPAAAPVAPAAAPAAPITGIPPQDIYEGKSLEVLDPDTGSWTSMSSVPDIERVLLKNGSAVRMPDGTMATNTGDNMGGVQAVPGGGLLINGLPINTALNPESQTPEQTAALRDLNIPAGGWPSDYAGSQTPWTGEAGPYAGAPIEDPYADWGTYATPEIPSIDLPPAERVDPRFGQDFDQWYSNVIDAQAGNLGRYYDFPTPQTGAAMMPLGMVPQPRTQTPQQFEALQFLLSGQGYDPATMARMRASATDAAAMAGQSGAGTARLMAQQAGLTGSPAAMAMEASARRMQGGATTRALNQIEIANAMQGMQNRATGAGMELNRQTSGAAMANQMALSNASNILGAMQTNVGNLQQSSLFNVGNRLGQQMTQAGQQSGLYGQGAGTYNQAALRRAGETAFFNPTQQMTRDFRQAQLKREKDLTDAGFSFNRFSGAQNLLGGLAGGTGSDFYGTGTNLYQWGEPGSAWAGLNFLSPAASGGVG